MRCSERNKSPQIRAATSVRHVSTRSNSKRDVQYMVCGNLNLVRRPKIEWLRSHSFQILNKFTPDKSPPEQLANLLAHHSADNNMRAYPVSTMIQPPQSQDSHPSNPLGRIEFQLSIW